MACRGVYYALLPDERLALLEAPDTWEQLAVFEAIYHAADADGRVLLVDKSWDAIHRVLCGGWLDFDHGDEVLRACVLGGRQLSDREDQIISYVEPPFVKRVAEALWNLTREWFRSEYFALDRNPPGARAHRYECELSEQDFEYTWSYFEDIRTFFRRAAERDLATVFNADQ